MFAGEAGAYFQALPANIRLGWKGLPGTNTLAFYEHSSIAEANSFITLRPGPNVIKLFSSVNYRFSKKARVFCHW